MKDREPTLESLALGSALQGAMTAAGLNGAELARRIGRSSSYISRVISGKRGGHVRDIVPWLDECGVMGARRQEILELRQPCHVCGCRELSPGDNGSNSEEEG